MTKTVALLPELVERVARAIDDALPESNNLTLAPSQIRRAAVAAIEATQTDQQLREEVERLRRALEKIANYKWPVSAGEFTETFYGEATGAEYKLKHHIPKEMASGALESVKRIARSSLSSSSLTK